MRFHCAVSTLGRRLAPVRRLMAALSRGRWVLLIGTCCLFQSIDQPIGFAESAQSRSARAEMGWFYKRYGTLEKAMTNREAWQLDNYSSDQLHTLIAVIEKGKPPSEASKDRSDWAFYGILNGKVPSAKDRSDWVTAGTVIASTLLRHWRAHPDDPKYVDLYKKVGTRDFISNVAAPPMFRKFSPYPAKAEEYIPREWFNETEFVLALLKKSLHTYIVDYDYLIGDAPLNDKSFMLQAIQINPWLYGRVGGSLKNDLDIARATAKKCGRRAFLCAPHVAKMDSQFLLNASESWGKVDDEEFYAAIPKDKWRDEKFVMALAAASSDCDFFAYLSPPMDLLHPDFVTRLKQVNDACPSRKPIAVENPEATTEDCSCQYCPCDKYFNEAQNLRWRLIDSALLREKRKPWGKQRTAPPPMNCMWHDKPQARWPVVIDILQKGSVDAKRILSHEILMREELPPEEVLEALYANSEDAQWADEVLMRCAKYSRVAEAYVLDRLELATKNSDQCFGSAYANIAAGLHSKRAKAALQRYRKMEKLHGQDPCD
jgi:hypothetical protein